MRDHSRPDLLSRIIAMDTFLGGNFENCCEEIHTPARLQGGPFLQFPNLGLDLKCGSQNAEQTMMSVRKLSISE